MKYLLTKNYLNCFKLIKLASGFVKCIKYSTIGCIESPSIELTNSVKHTIENYWKDKLSDDRYVHDSNKEKFYVLSMFPYPSGQLHMGHVRVYTISDAVARFYRMNGKNVMHPMGWDAFGLPAENAAIQRKVPANVWTRQNIVLMKEQLKLLGASFDWSRELATCDPNYYKWTQYLFLELYKSGLAYQNESTVNWDPIDKTVLADEQVDNAGRSWRSGAKVEKKLLNQWFIKTTKFAKPLFEGLDDPTLQDWRDIIKLQKHWIGECDGYSFDLKLENSNKKLTIWTKYPEDLAVSSFITLKTTHCLSLSNENELKVKNPFSKKYPSMSVVFSDDAEFPEFCDNKLGVPFRNDIDRDLAERNKIDFTMDESNLANREYILLKAQNLKIGGFPVSSKLKDWLISRQRYWGTPIPIVHCSSCGTVPVNEKDLPVLLPEFDPNSNELPTKSEKWFNTTCPKCNGPAKRETDTMDTFVDSSWYFLRFLDPNNANEIFDKNLSKALMPVDIYIGGKEHAVLHLYYARFVNHFLHSIGLVPNSEPFKRLLVQGMVMGRSYRLKSTGKYLKDDEVEIINAKKNKAVEKSSSTPVIMTWEKMSKSKLNGVNPADMIKEYGCDTTRLIMLADVAPTSHRNWSSATFPGIINWQKRLWLTINDFQTHRNTLNPNVREALLANPEFNENDQKMNDSRNYYIKGVTFNFKYSHQLSVGISKMQGLTNSIRRADRETIQFSGEYERALGSQIIMLAPMAPHFASELWSLFVNTKNRINHNIEDFRWDCSVLDQKWPEVDQDYKLDLSISINNFEQSIYKIPRNKLDEITQWECEEIALNLESVRTYIGDKKIRNVNFVLYPGYEAQLMIYLFQSDRKVANKE